jgi:hypothetical protein
MIRIGVTELILSSIVIELLGLSVNYVLRRCRFNVADWWLS